jgi:hypothetical protein
MPAEISGKCSPQGDKHQWHYSGGQQNVAGQNRKVNFADPTMALKVNITDIIVIHAVRDEERARDHDRC